ncbi:tRNA-dihydrouridine synthase [Haloferax namakaokahaiae]|uniref:tRNA-dihydrouridine synthase n=1 Tax=Haloferax namakaokahaiae TaxID=1748331 RepID=A0ABD5ZAU4_9EURY
MSLPRVAVASLSGESDADWARAAEPYVDAAVLGGIALDEESQRAAQRLVARGRSEFLTDEPIDFLDSQLAAVTDLDLFVAVNVRATSADPVREASRVCANYGAGIEINAHCRQAELCEIGCGEALLRDTERLCEYVEAAAESGAPVGVKVRTEIEGVDLSKLAPKLADVGATWLHVDAMDSESVVADVADTAPDLFLVANNGVRDRKTVHEYLDHGADAVSVGRPSDNPTVLERVRDATAEWFDGDGDGEIDGDDREVPV